MHLGHYESKSHFNWQSDFFKSFSIWKIDSFNKLLDNYKVIRIFLIVIRDIERTTLLFNEICQLISNLDFFLEVDFTQCDIFSLFDYILVLL